MTRIPFVGATYQLRTIRADCQSSINYYPENIESGAGANGEKGVLLQVPGLNSIGTYGTGPIRGIYYTSTGKLAVVSGNELYGLDSAYTATLIGTLNTFSGPVDMADNGVQLIVVDGSTSGYLVDLANGTFELINSDGFYGADRVAYQDGYFILNRPGTNQFYISNLYDGSTFDALDYAAAEGNPDAIESLVCNQRQLWIAGYKSMEVYWNSGDTFPFTRIDGSFQEFGCGATFSLQKIAGTVMWLTDLGYVVMAEGYKPSRVSNHAVELAIRESGDFSQAYAFTYTQDGHYFYCLQLPGASTTWCYDIVSQQWHERAEFINGAFAKSRVSFIAHAFGDIVVGDSSNGNLYLYDMNTLDNDGTPLVRERTCPHITNGLKRMSISKFQLDIDGGQGVLSGQGSAPLVMFQVSKDGGYTWSPWRTTTIGPIGKFKSRAIFRQLGQSRDWVFRVRISDPVKANLLGADIDASPAAS